MLEDRLAAPRASSVQPVGLFGELMYSARVPGVSASSSRSRSSVQPAAAKSQRHGRTTSAPRIFGISTRFGHSGVTTTTRSPGPTSACDASISADMPDAGDGDVRRLDVGRCSRVTYAAMRLAQLGNAEVLRVEGLARARARRLPRLRMNSGVSSSGSPNQNGSMSGFAHAGVGDFADLRGDERAHGAAGVKSVGDGSAVVHWR